MKFVLFFVSLATFLVYSQAAVAYGGTCTTDTDCTDANAACVGTTTKTCGCAATAFSETVGTTTSCYKKIGVTGCVAVTAACHSSATCSASGACYCPNPKTPDTNLQKCITAGAAGIAASILSVAVVVVTSRFL